MAKLEEIKAASIWWSTLPPEKRAEYQSETIDIVSLWKRDSSLDFAQEAYVHHLTFKGRPNDEIIALCCDIGSDPDHSCITLLGPGGHVLLAAEERRYSEDEVILLLQKYRLDLSSGKTPVVGDTIPDWFNKNKKQ